MLAQIHPNPQVSDDYRTGQQLYWQGKADSRCANVVQVQGWYDACTEDAKGCDAYLRCMWEDAESGADVDWNAVGEVVYNAYGDRVWEAK